MAKVTVYSTVGKNGYSFESTAKNLRELKAELAAQGSDTNNMKMVIGANKNTLEADEASVPQEDWQLFMLPIKTKSGADRKELFAQIKAAIEKNPAMKQNFIIDGKNMTQLSTATLETLVAKHLGGSAAIAPAAKATSTKAEPTKKVEAPSAPVAKSERAAEANSSNKQKLEQALNIIGDVTFNDDKDEELVDIYDQLKSFIEECDTPVDNSKKEKEKADREAAQQLEDMKRMFPDVKK